MEVLGVGPTELLFIIIIALIVLGPKDLEKTGRTVGRWLNGIVQSDTWKAVKKTSQELRRLPTQLMRDDNIQNYPLPSDLEREAQQKRDAWTGGTPQPIPPRADPGPGAADENRIHPPVKVTASPAKPSKPAPKKPASSKKPPAAKTSRSPRKKKNA